MIDGRDAVPSGEFVFSEQTVNYMSSTLACLPTGRMEGCHVIKENHLYNQAMSGNNRSCCEFIWADVKARKRCVLH